MSDQPKTYVYTRVREVMTTPSQTIDGLASVRHAIDRMRDERVSSLVIDRRHEGDEYGMLSVHDIAGEVIAKGRSPERTSVYEIMSKPVLSVKPEMDIRYCARIFLRFGISAAPVIQGGEILGIVAYDQLVMKGLATQS